MVCAAASCVHWAKCDAKQPNPHHFAMVCFGPRSLEADKAHFIGIVSISTPFSSIGSVNRTHMFSSEAASHFHWSRHPIVLLYHALLSNYWPYLTTIYHTNSMVAAILYFFHQTCP